MDDGSRDETARVLHELTRADARVRGLRLSRNFGQQIATTAGLEHAAGDAVVIMDADLQDPPELIEAMLARWREGYHVAYAQRTERTGENCVQTLERQSFLSARPTHLALAHSDRHRRLSPHGSSGRQRVLAHAGAGPLSARNGELGRLSANRRALQARGAFRRHDQLSSLENGQLRDRWHRLLFLRAPAARGLDRLLCASGCALLGIIYAILLRFFADPSQWVRGWASLFVAILFMGGVQLISLGIIGEYVGRIYGEVKQRPLYFVWERFGFPRAVDPSAGQSAETGGSYVHRELCANTPFEEKCGPKQPDLIETC